MESRFFYNVDDKSEPFHNEENVSDDISEALMRGVIRDLRASIKNPQDYTARTDPNVPIEEVAGVMAIQNRYSMMARWHEVLFWRNLQPRRWIRIRNCWHCRKIWQGRKTPR